MTDEIKFRGKRLDNGEWVKGFYAKTNNGQHIIASPALDDIFEVDPTTVSQFTGMTDKTGLYIYGDDIVKYKVGPNWITGRVYYSAEWATWFKGNNQPLSSYRKTTEVIGNTHDDRWAKADVVSLELLKTA